MPLILSVFLALLLLPAAALSAGAVPADQIAASLGVAASGQDSAFGRAVAPAQSLDAGAAPAARVAAMIARIGQEVERVTTAFTAAPAAERIGRTKAAVAQFSAETARDGASRSFEGTGPSLSIMRQLLFVPLTGANAAQRLMQVISRFERSPKTDDNYYEYPDPADPKRSPVVDLPGSDTSWTTAARPPMTPGTVYALKKCRHIVILGWYCNSSLYQVRDLAGAEGAVTLMLVLLRPLPKGADNAMFSDARAENTVDGYSSVYVVLAAAELVLVYDLGIQSKADAASQQGRLNDGHKEEYRRLVARIEAELGTGKLPF